MMKKELLVSVLMMFCLLSCNNDLMDDCKENVNTSMTKSVDFVPDTMDLKFIYQNKQYMSTCLVYDDYIDVLDEEVKVVYKSIKSKPMAALMRHDGFVEYFDKEEDLLKKFGEHMKMEKAAVTKSISFSDQRGLPEDDWNNNPNRYKARAFLYDDKNFSGRRCKDIVLENPGDAVDIPNLKEYDSFNDKCSSVKVQNYNFGVYALLVVYENDTYNKNDSGNSYYFYAGYMDQADREYEHANLKYIFVDAVPPLPESRIDSWNDRISSCKFYFCSPNNFPEVD